MLTATLAEDSQTATSNFDVFIKDPCSTAIFQAVTPSPLVDMLMILYYNTAEVISQPISILTDIEQTNSIVCPITAVLAPSHSFMILKPDFTLLTLDGSATSQLDIGIYSFTLTVSSPNFVSVASVVYSY